MRFLVGMLFLTTFLTTTSCSGREDMVKNTKLISTYTELLRKEVAEYQSKRTQVLEKRNEAVWADERRALQRELLVNDQLAIWAISAPVKLEIYRTLTGNDEEHADSDQALTGLLERFASGLEDSESKVGIRQTELQNVVNALNTLVDDRKQSKQRLKRTFKYLGATVKSVGEAANDNGE